MEKGRTIIFGSTQFLGVIYLQLRFLVIKYQIEPGAVALKRNEIDVREIEIDITLWANDDADLRAKTRALAEFLIYTEDKPLYFSDEPGMVYYARFNSDSTDLEEIIAIGEGTLNFTCFDPFAYRPYEVNQTNPSEPTIFINNGTAETYPRIRIVPYSSVDFLIISNLTTNNFYIILIPLMLGILLFLIVRKI